MTGLIANGWFWAGAFTAVLAAGIWLTARFGGTGKGQHRAPRGFTADDELTPLPCERVIPRARTEHEPPWLPAPVIEPATVITGPPEPEPGAYWLAAGTISDGRLRTLRVDVLPPPVEAILGHRTVDEAVESIFTRAMALKVRALTDGRS